MKKVKWILWITTTIMLSIPLLAGQGGGGGAAGGGGGNAGVPPVEIGTLYGDLYIVLRNDDGVPVLDEFGCVQPISSITNEPFQLHTNELEDVFCEVTEEMATWIQTVDFGRLNLGRAPQFVQNRGFDEVIKALNSATEVRLGPAGRLVLTVNDEDKTIDSPRENLALYIKLMKDGHWITLDTSPITHGDGPPEDQGPPEGDGPSAEERPVLSDNATSLLSTIGYGALGDSTRSNQDLNSEDLWLAASLLAAAADKTGSITLDMVIYINSVYGINQHGSLPGETEGKTYFNFRSFDYYRDIYRDRYDLECANGEIWVLSPVTIDGDAYWKATCLDIIEEVFDNELEVEINNVKGFTQAADDALQVIEHAHNYSIPVPLD